jgi:predicted short-subunit dehydrogenase-like oxidoreductase (DUF2520 family)
MLRLNLIGGGQVGKTLACLLTQKAGFSLQHVLHRSQESAQQACDFIQQGMPTTDYRALTPADCYLITVPDRSIARCVEALAACHVLAPGNIVFHCSGFLASDILQPAQSQGAHTASMHPIKSFVDPLRSIQTFAGTYCALEGDSYATGLLGAWIEQIGGISFPLQAENKALYHTAFVIASNYLVVLHETALQTLQKAGIPTDFSQKILAPIMQHTLQQSFSLGVTQALSGPIARGDTAVVAAEIAALQQWNPAVSALYRMLGEMALPLAQQKGLGVEAVEAMAQILTRC